MCCRDTYGFEVQNPVQKEIEVPQRYSFDYQIQTPVVKSEPSTLQGLLAHVDRVVVQKQGMISDSNFPKKISSKYFPSKDCPEKSECQCNSYKPTIDVLQRCPKHGHHYRYGGALYPNQQRYNNDLSTFQPQIPDQVLTSSGRSKRDVAMTFPMKIQILPGLRRNNQITKVQSVEDENENRIAQVLKTNFGEDIEELLRPKPLGPAQKIESNEAKVQNIAVPATSDFISKIEPKLQEARSNLRSKISKIVNKARLNAIRAKHLIEKRSTESKKTMGNTGENVEESDTKSIINELADEGGDTSVSRCRKHCNRCGELAKKLPCPSCGAYPSEGSQPHYFETKQINPTTYVPRHAKQTPQPKYGFTQSGQRYVENNIKPKFVRSRQGDDVSVGSYHRRPAYSELQDILDRNSKSLYSQNRRLGDDHLVQPMDFEHASDAIRFIEELTQRNNNQQNADYYSNGNSYDVGARSQNYHQKRSYKIVRVAAKDDGSVLVKISPNTDRSKLNSESKVTAMIDRYAKYDDDDAKTSNLHGKNKFVQVDEKFKILPLSANGSEEGSEVSEEDLGILKYIYAKEHTDENTIEKNKPTNTVVQVET